MEKTLVLIHTVAPLVGVFNQLGAEMLPGVRLMHILDEPLLERVRQRGSLHAEDATRLQDHITMAEQVQAQAALVTCSTISPCVNSARLTSEIPVLKIDEAMIAEAVRLGGRVGVIATSHTTLEPTRQMLLEQAASVGKSIQVELVHVEDALAILIQGDGETHDRLVKQAVIALSPSVDVVVLAQASMGRVLKVLKEPEHRVPVLASPQLALLEVKKIMDQA